MLVFTGLDYVNRLQAALDRASDEFDTGLPLETREALTDELETYCTRSMTADAVTGAGIRRAMTVKQTYLAKWAFAFDHEQNCYRWIDTTQRHAALALQGCTVLIPYNA